MKGKKPYHLDSSSEGEVVELVGDFQLEEVVDGEEVEHPAVHPGFQEGVLVLRQANIVQPAGHPLQRILRWNKEAFFIDLT